MKSILFLLVFCPFWLSAQVMNDELAIKHLLQQQVIAWNKSNLDAFMEGYWKNDSLQFIGKNGPVYGYIKTLANYKVHYTSKAAMGHFTSTILTSNL
ncbi:hypothetical protein [Hydrotalea sp.]|uniref:hypothetical protein n=1 Tax=Hydrotalea sp. TaxID=2881279 RepID=UPI002618F1A8|nr:hypothetical protein [Hydrotalea sp.]